MATPLGEAPLHPLVPPDSIVLRFGPTSMPDTAYVQIAYIEVQGAKYDDVSDLIPKLRKKAAAVSANAVINIETGSYQGSRGEAVMSIIAATDGDDSTTSDREDYVGTVVRGVAVYIKPAPALSEQR